MRLSLCRFIVGALCIITSPAQAVEFSVLGDVLVNGGSRSEDKASFSLGRLDLYASQDVSDNSKAFFEIVFEGKDHAFDTEIERMWVERRVSDALNFRAGRMHTPLGFWNYNYHHGVLVQDTVSRPFFLEFEEGAEGLFPTHLIGLLANGQWRNDDTAFSYVVGAANGPSINSRNWSPTQASDLDVNNVRDFNSDKLLVGRATFTHLIKRFQIGVFAMKNDIVESGEPSDTGALSGSGLAKGKPLFKQYVSGFDFRYSGDKLYVMGEYFYIRTDDRISNPSIAPVTGTHNSFAYYAQVGFRLWQHVTPVLRFEGMEKHGDDSYYNLRHIEQEQHYVVGLRYELDDSSALRFEVNQGKPQVGKQYTTAAVQWFFLLF